MARASITVSIKCDIQKVWDTVTSLTDYAWRSDISGIETLSRTQFVERTKNGYPTSFTVTACEPCKRWEFDMENSNMKGHWAGVFTAEDGYTKLDFTEEARSKKLLMRPFVKGYLKRQQKLYVADLEKALR